MAYSPEAIREAYDEIAEREDRFEKGHALRNEIPREFIRRYLGASDVVLDAGGGTGINAIMMARHCRRVTLVDISPKILKLAAVNIQNAGLAERIDLIEGDITHLEPFEDAEFSFVVCLGGSVSYVLENAPEAVQELVRVVRRGSVLIIGCDSKYGFMRLHLSEGRLGEALRMYETSEYKVGKGVCARLYTVTEMTRLLEAAGCEIVEVVSTPTLLASFSQDRYCEAEDKWAELVALELKLCTIPELLGMGHHLFCGARKV